MEDQRDLISNPEQLPILGQRPGAPERYVGAAGESTENPGPHRCAAGGLDGEPQEGRIPALTPGDREQVFGLLWASVLAPVK